jgi:exodeoxyribonuclease VII small subunit
MVKKQATYQELQEQLDAILARLQAPDIQVDDAVQLYEQGLAAADALEAHLKDAENRITALKLQSTQLPAAE